MKATSFIVENVAVRPVKEVINGEEVVRLVKEARSEEVVVLEMPKYVADWVVMALGSSLESISGDSYGHEFGEAIRGVMKVVSHPVRAKDQ